MSVIKVTEAHEEFVIINIKNMRIKEMAAALNLSTTTIQKIIGSLGLAGTKRNYDMGYFKKKHTPHNKGVKKLTSEKSIPTQFKKGLKPHTTKPVGTISLRRESSNTKSYDYYIKYMEHKWKPLRQYVWEQVKGSIPAGHIVVYKGGKRHDYAIDNLECITRAELAKRNHHRERIIAHYDTGLAYTPELCATRMAIKDKGLKDVLLQNPELLETIQLNMKLKRQIKCKKKSVKN